jgi:aerobic-type carbon monoxide dehydrogenase small subunit (CoxS/CutS family)
VGGTDVPGTLPMDRTVELIVNGEPRIVDVAPHHTLLDVLRNDLGLTGTKECCLVGECGACTVIMNGRTVDSCLVLAVEADGSSVLTVEGLAAPDGQLAPLQAAFLDKGAVQCGFCIPGQLLSAHALLLEHPHPTPAEIEEGIAGNLCRCGCYEQIFEAIEAAAEGTARGTGTPAAHAARKAGGTMAGGRSNAEGLDQ